MLRREKTEKMRQFGGGGCAIGVGGQGNQAGQAGGAGQGGPARGPELICRHFGRIRSELLLAHAAARSRTRPLAGRAGTR